MPRPPHTSRTYAMPERSDHLDFYIRDQTARSPITESHKHDYFQIQINLGGDTHQEIGDTVRPFPHKAIAFVLPHRVHRIPHPAQSRFLVLNFSLDFLLGRRPSGDTSKASIAETANEPMLAPFLLQEQMDFLLNDTQIAEVETLAQRMIELDQHRQFGDTVLLRGYLLQLIGMICRSHREAIEAHSATGALRAARPDSAFARVSDHLRATLSDPALSGASIAAHMSLPARYVADLVKRETGKTVVQWITQTRIDTAKKLLDEPGRQIKDIAFQVGYRDETYFTRRFRQVTGQSPSEYRVATTATRATKPTTTKTARKSRRAR
jgi:AraC-like DNA-binding protein